MHCRYRAPPARHRRRVTSSTWLSSLFALFLLASRLRMFDGLADVAPNRLGPLEADMQADRARIDVEIDGRVRPRGLDAHDLGRHDQALMSAPAHAELEEPQAIGEGRDVDSLAEHKGKQPRGSFQSGRQPIAKA